MLFLILLRLYAMMRNEEGPVLSRLQRFIVKDGLYFRLG